MHEESMNKVANLHVVSVYDVLVAMSELKTGKAVGPDGIPAEAFIYGGHRLAVLLCYFLMRAFFMAICHLHLLLLSSFPLSRIKLDSCQM